MQRRDFLQTAAGVAATLGSASFVAAADAPLAAGSPNGKIRIGQIGTGHAHASGKMEAIRRLGDRYEVVGIVERDPALKARAEKSAVYAGLPWLTEDELLATPGLAAVAVETRMADSAATAARAIAAGKHIHLDKPGAMDHDDFVRLRRNAERRGLIVQMGYMLRYNPAFVLLFQAAREGWLGDVLEIDCMMGKLAPAGMRKELAELPGGGMFELACHVIDAVVTVLGKPERVQAFTKRTRSSVSADAAASDDAFDEAADNQLAVLEYPRATATVRCNHADPFGGPRRRFQAAGTRGAIEIMPLESGKLRLMLSEPHGAYKKGEQSVALEVPPGRYDGEFVDLARCIRGENKFAWTADHDIAVHEAVLRASGAWRE